MFSVSVPAPPSITSPESSVVAAAPVTPLVAGALIVSSESPPEIVSTPVVSDQVRYIE
jgi:hypothetical protein